MHQQVKDRLAKAALAEISHLEWEMLDEQQLAQLYEWWIVLAKPSKAMP